MGEAAGGYRPLQPRLQTAGGGLGWGGGEGVRNSQTAASGPGLKVEKLPLSK